VRQIQWIFKKPYFKKANMKLENTFKKLPILLFLIGFNLSAAELSEKNANCVQALNQGDISKAVSISSDILKSDAKNRDGLLCKGRALGAQGNYQEALSALEVGAKQSKEPFEQIISHLLIGNLHKQNKEYVAAMASYNKSLTLCLQEKNQKFSYINYNLIGETQALSGDLNAALTSYKTGEKIAMNDGERADSYERLANTYSVLGQHDLAIEHQVKATLLQKRTGTLDQNANASMEMGRIYTAAKEYQNAERAYLKLIQFAKDNGGAYYEAKANMGLAQTKMAMGDMTTAKSLLTDSEKIAKSIGADDLIAEIDDSLNKISIQK
jgi:tetratricopeptide (TPR) repeat protein